MFLGELVAKLGVDTSGLRVAETQLSRFGVKASSIFSSIQKQVFSLRGAFISLGGGLAIRSIINSVSEYETALIDMGKVTGQSFDVIDKQIKSLDASLGNSIELMKGYYQVISAGVTEPNKALETLTTASKLSKVAHVEQADTVRALTKLMAGYRDSLTSTEQAANLLLKTEKLGQTSVAELVPVIGDVANISNLAGARVEEMAAALALITQTAGSTAEATTQLKALMRSVVKPTDELVEVFKEFGSVSNALKQLGLVEWLRRVKEAGGDAAGVAALLGGRQESLIAFSALLANNFQNLAQNIEELSNSTGTLDKAWKEYRGTFAATWGEFKAQFKNLIIDFAQKVLPSLTKAVQFANEHMEDMIKVVGSLIAVWAGIKVGGLVLSFMSFASAIGTTTVAVKGLNIALTTLWANPATWPIVVGFGTLISLLVKFNSLSEKAKEQIRSTYSVLGTGGGLLKDLPLPKPGGNYDETAWRNEQLAQVVQKSKSTTETSDLEAFKKQIEEDQKKWKKVEEAAEEYRKELQLVGKTAKEVALIKLDQWLEEQRKELGIITPELKALYDARKKEILGPTKQEAFSKAFSEFAAYVKNMVIEAKEMTKQLGMSSEEASSVFQKNIVQKAEETISKLIGDFDDPYFKARFIKALEDLGKTSGNRLFTAIAQELKGVPDKVKQVTSSVVGIKEMNLWKTGELSPTWGVGSVLESMRQDPWWYQTIMKQGGQQATLLKQREAQLGITPEMEQSLNNVAAKVQESVSPIKATFEEALKSLATVGAQAGADVGKSFHNGVVAEIKKAVEEAKKEIGNLATKVTITVDVKNKSLTNTMRGDL
jgi:TP901 family phage tail tape measure protein